ncbi:glycoside hydrolase superfamily [Aspergillus coremiiformis]|uniref:Glycoside hydrolase superfamily n=1 Tax=Aspergillus coremiiformis TaxID=138285 RepID=A0A5N6Z6A6_9EURO|nr:glycoside hydrolase superfamily [Aspergillus coremiiformis]
MLSFLTCFSKRRKPQSPWKEIEEAARDLESRPSWNAPENTLLLEAFEWHLPDDQGHWRRLRQGLSGWKEMGIDQIWIPPGCKAMNASGNGYDIYDLYDLGEFDQKGSRATKWGSRRELEELVMDAQALDMGVYWDAVLNHKAGADYPERFEAVAVDPHRRNVAVSKPVEIAGWTGFDFAGRGDRYSAMKYHWSHFNGVDWDDARRENGIFRVADKTWASDVGQEHGNYDYLMFANLDYSHPAVREDVLRWGTWICQQLPLRGMRLDAAKHFSTAFQREFIAHVRQTNPDLRVIGEYWSGDLTELLGYLKQMDYGVMAVDVPLVINLSRTSHTKGADLREIFTGTLVQSQPDHALTFVSNHDTVPGQMLETPVAPSFKPLAYALVLLRKEGHPCVFYGDLYGTLGDKPLPRACDGQLPILTRARKLYAYGEQQDYFDQANCIGFVRYGDARHSGLACVLSNGTTAEKRMYVGRKHARQPWTDLLHDRDSVVIDASGYGVFPVDGMSVSVWIPASDRVD